MGIHSNIMKRAVTGVSNISKKLNPSTIKQGAGTFKRNFMGTDAKSWGKTLSGHEASLKNIENRMKSGHYLVKGQDAVESAVKTRSRHIDDIADAQIEFSKAQKATNKARKQVAGVGLGAVGVAGLATSRSKNKETSYGQPYPRSY